MKLIKYYGIAVLLLALAAPATTSSDAKRLYDDLLGTYNKLIRPVGNNSDTLTVKLGLRLSQLVDIDEKNQIMTTNVWLRHEWIDHKMHWTPSEYGGVEVLYVPSTQIWLPDIVLYNNADGNYQVTLMTKATLHYKGRVIWEPPAIYKSSCTIDVEFFPFDMQACTMKFGSWTYDGYQVDLRHINQPEKLFTTPDKDKDDYIELGIDLKEFYQNVEWDIFSATAKRTEKFYTCCAEPYPDLTFSITMRRKTLFYTVNLIIPCVAISFLSVLVFYLPSDSGEKVTLCISILLSLTVFFLLLAEIIPPTSLVVPLIGKYLLFTMILVTLSIIVTVIVLNIHFRSSATHVMSPWTRQIFLRILPRLLMIRKASTESDQEVETNQDGLARNDEAQDEELADDSEISDFVRKQRYGKDAAAAMDSVNFIAQHMRRSDKESKVIEDWKYVAMVLDRLFLWIFTTACLVGTVSIIMQAPALYDTRTPLTS